MFAASVWGWIEWLTATSISTALRESDVMFPVVETVHVLGIALLAGAAAIVDLRLLGFVLSGERVSTVAGKVLPYAWWGLGIMSASGALLFGAKATTYAENPAFQIKAGLLVLAGLNPLVFHTTIYRSVATWDDGRVPARARLTAIVSLTLWSAIIITGRAIAYVPRF